MEPQSHSRLLYVSATLLILIPLLASDQPKLEPPQTSEHTILSAPFSHALVNPREAVEMQLIVELSDPSVVGLDANLSIVGLRNVLLQGLTISGEETGISLIQPSTSIPASLTIDHCTITDLSDPLSGIGISVDSGGSVFVLQSTISDHRAGEHRRILGKCHPYGVWQRRSPIGKPISRTLNSNGQLLESVSSPFGLSDGPLSTGYLVVHGDMGGLAGFTIFRYDDGRAQSGAAVPATSILRAKLFSHIAHGVAAGSGVNYQTGIALLNPLGIPTRYTMQVYDGTGKKVAEKTDVIGAGEKISKILSHPAAGAGYFSQPLLLGSGHIEVTSDYGLIGFELFFTEDLSQLASVPAQISD